MRKSTLPDKNMIVAYWLNAELTNTFACPPLRDVVCFTQKDGSPQIDAINLFGASFACGPNNFAPPYIRLAPSLANALQNGDVRLLQKAGIKVVLSVTGATGCVQWSSVPKDNAQDFANWVNQNILQHYGLDGIDIDDEYGTGPTSDDQLVAVVTAMDKAFPSDKIISKALWQDDRVVGRIKDCLTYGCTMSYGNNADSLEKGVTDYHNAGLGYNQILIGVNAGPISQPQGNFTSIATTKAVTAWQPPGGTKRGMMLWSFSQDIQQFTADPQYATPYISPNDHEWLKTIVQAMRGADQWVVKQDCLTGPYLPWGSYFDSVRDIKVTLSASCKTKSGGTKNSTLEIASGTTGDIVNDDGVLRQTGTGPDEKAVKEYMAIKAQKGLGVYVPNGSFLLSSAGIKLVLSAKCRKINQQEVDSSLDVTALDESARVENVDGVLTIRDASSFDDTRRATLLGSPITKILVRSGEVVNAIQVTNGSYPSMPQHGGKSGAAATVMLDAGDSIVEVSGYTGTWFGWNCVLQVTLKTKKGTTYGPYGTRAHATSQVPFSYVAPAGQALLAFSGTIVNVPLADGSRTDIIASLGVQFK